jgi:GDP-4-dehydro-6-deoxy-D-mannose reductase
MTVLVTGAAGFVGSHLIERLSRDGGPILGWYRPGSDTSRLRSGVRWSSVELLDRESVGRAIADSKPRAVYHLAGWAHPGQSWDHPLDTYQNNVLATHHLLSAIAEHVPPARVLVSCSGTIYAPQDRALNEADPVAPASPYATSKLAQEMLARQAFSDDGVQTLIARSFNHTGPGQDASYVAPAIARQIARIERGLQEPILRLGNLEPKRDISDVRDVVEAYVAMMARARPGKPYNVCSSRDLSIRSLVETFVSRARTSVTVVQDRALFRPNDIPILVGDHTHLTTDTGWIPSRSLEQTVDDLLDYWRDKTSSA